MPSPRNHPFGIQALLDLSDVKAKSVAYRRAEGIFLQGDACNTVLYIQKGGVKLSVRSRTGKEVVVALLGPGEFFGEGCMAGQPRRMGSATATILSTVLVLKKKEMLGLLHKQRALADRFVSHLLSTNVRIEQDLIDQLFNHDEKRLARTLLLLARYGSEHPPEIVLPRVSLARLAKMAGTTHSQV